MVLSSIVIILLILANLWLLNRYSKYRSKLKQAGFLRPWPIPQVSVGEISSAFEVNSLGPTLKAEVKFIGRGDLNVPGGTSDTEAWILAVLSKDAKQIFEFGTCTGKTTYLMAVNSSSDTRIVTLTLPPDQLTVYSKDAKDSGRAVEDALHESAFTEFLYNKTPVEGKVTQLFCDSKHFDHQPYRNQFDLIFIDGSHAYSYVLADSEKALEMIAPGGTILWHDYRGPHETRDVYKALNELRGKINLQHIKDTSLVVFQKSK